MAFQLPALPYSFNALEPHIDARTMEIHHGKHHAAYTNNLNAAIEGTPLEGKSIEEILGQVSKQSPAVRNNGGGFYNHNLFWEIMSPDGGGEPSGALADDITNRFGSFNEFKEAFGRAATTQFGSGWAWLMVDAAGALAVINTPNQDNPLMDVSALRGTLIAFLIGNNK
jgi:superoxide dismutase, Fe-Mn family